MREHKQDLYVGAPRGTELRKTLDLITGKLRRLGTFAGARMLDVGCGDGSFTIVLGRDFQHVSGIDVQEDALRRFRESVAGDALWSREHVGLGDDLS